MQMLISMLNNQIFYKIEKRFQILKPLFFVEYFIIKQILFS